MSGAILLQSHAFLYDFICQHICCFYLFSFLDCIFTASNTSIKNSELLMDVLKAVKMGKRNGLSYFDDSQIVMLDNCHRPPFHCSFPWKSWQLSDIIFIHQPVVVGSSLVMVRF